MLRTRLPSVPVGIVVLVLVLVADMGDLRVTVDAACPDPTADAYWTAAEPCPNQNGACAGSFYQCSTGPGNCGTFASAETCDGVDDDCDGLTDEGVSTTVFNDWDMDGQGDSSGTPFQVCTVGPQQSPNKFDCDDGDPSIYSGATEVCNGNDDDCDGATDEGVSVLVYSDFDQDGFGDQGGSPWAVCSVGTQQSVDNTDCDDGDASISPNATEICDGIDQDCDMATDEGLVLGTMCGVGACFSTGSMACMSGTWGGNTCMEGMPASNDATCDGVDDDCDTFTDENCVIAPATTTPPPPAPTLAPPPPTTLAPATPAPTPPPPPPTTLAPFMPTPTLAPPPPTTLAPATPAPTPPPPPPTTLAPFMPTPTLAPPPPTTQAPATPAPTPPPPPPTTLAPATPAPTSPPPVATTIVPATPTPTPSPSMPGTTLAATTTAPTSAVPTAVPPELSSLLPGTSIGASVTFTLPVNAAPGTVMLSFTATGGAADQNSPHQATLRSEYEVAGDHEVRLADLGIYLAEGTVYEVTVSYEDASTGRAASKTVAGLPFEAAADRTERSSTALVVGLAGGGLCLCTAVFLGASLVSRIRARRGIADQVVKLQPGDSDSAIVGGASMASLSAAQSESSTVSGSREEPASTSASASMSRSPSTDEVASASRSPDDSTDFDAVNITSSASTSASAEELVAPSVRDSAVVTPVLATDEAPAAVANRSSRVSSALVDAALTKGDAGISASISERVVGVLGSTKVTTPIGSERATEGGAAPSGSRRTRRMTSSARVAGGSSRRSSRRRFSHRSSRRRLDEDDGLMAELAAVMGSERGAAGGHDASEADISVDALNLPLSPHLVPDRETGKVPLLASLSTSGSASSSFDLDLGALASLRSPVSVGSPSRTRRLSSQRQRRSLKSVRSDSSLSHQQTTTSARTRRLRSASSSSVRTRRLRASSQRKVAAAFGDGAGVGVGSQRQPILPLASLSERLPAEATAVDRDDSVALTSSQRSTSAATVTAPGAQVVIDDLDDLEDLVAAFAEGEGDA